MRTVKYLKTAIAALSLVGASTAHSALTPIDVTWNPSAAGITNAGAFTFNDIVLNTFANIDLNSAGTSFSEQGFLRLSVFTLNGLPTSIPNAGFPTGSPYSLYISFSGTGTQTAGTPSFGQFTSLTYSLLGAPGTTTFTPSAAGTFSASGPAPVTLATGSLTTPGSVAITTDPVSGLLLPAAQITASFNPNPAFAGFFVNPPATAPLSVTAAFTNTGTVVTSTPLGGGATRLTLNGGGGNATLALGATPPGPGPGPGPGPSPVPEPDTYGLVLAGLALLAFAAKRKTKRSS